MKLAELEIRYAESFASDIEGNTARQIALEALALNYQKQRLATQVEIYQRSDIESTLQASLIEIGRNLGLEITPIVEASNNQEAIIDLQEQIDRLQKSPLLPDDIEQLLNKVNQFNKNKEENLYLFLFFLCSYVHITQIFFFFLLTHF